MEMYTVDVIEKPTKVGAEGGERPKIIVKGLRVLASSERGAIFMAGRSVTKETSFAEERLDFAVTHTPFGQ